MRQGRIPTITTSRAKLSGIRDDYDESEHSDVDRRLHCDRPTESAATINPPARVEARTKAEHSMRGITVVKLTAREHAWTDSAYGQREVTTMNYLPGASYYIIRASKARLRRPRDQPPADTRALILEKKHGLDLFVWLAMLRDIRALPETGRSASDRVRKL